MDILQEIGCYVELRTGVELGVVSVVEMAYLAIMKDMSGKEILCQDAQSPAEEDKK